MTSPATSPPVTDSAGALAYAVHPYIFKSDPNAWKTACAKLAGCRHRVRRRQRHVNRPQHLAHPVQRSIYSNYMSSFESIGMGWTAWAWIVDEWGCGFPQMIADYSGTPNAIGTPVQAQLKALNP